MQFVKKTYHFLSLVKQHQTRLTVLKLPSVVYSKAALVHPNFFIIATRPMFVTFSEGWTLKSNGYFCLLSRSGELEACDTYQKMKIEPTLNMTTKKFQKTPCMLCSDINNLIRMSLYWINICFLLKSIIWQEYIFLWIRCSLVKALIITSIIVFTHALFWSLEDNSNAYCSLLKYIVITFFFKPKLSYKHDNNIEH